MVYLTLNFNSQLVLRTVEIQNVRPDSVLAAKLSPERRIFQASPKNLFCRCRIVA
jgi:hypothetical protein